MGFEILSDEIKNATSEALNEIDFGSLAKQIGKTDFSNIVRLMQGKEEKSGGLLPDLQLFDNDSSLNDNLPQLQESMQKIGETMKSISESNKAIFQNVIQGIK